MSNSAVDPVTDGVGSGWFFGSLRGYRPEWWRNDLIAGLTVWAVLVPEALAYATIAGVSPVIGLYAAPPALILYAVFGSSKHLVTGPMAATAALSAAAVADVATDDNFVAFTAILALVTGVLALVAGVTLMLAHNIGQVRDLIPSEQAARDVKPRLYPTIDEALAAVPPVRFFGPRIDCSGADTADPRRLHGSTRTQSSRACGQTRPHCVIDPASSGRPALPIPRLLR